MKKEILIGLLLVVALALLASWYWSSHEEYAMTTDGDDVVLPAGDDGSSMTEPGQSGTTEPSTTGQAPTAVTPPVEPTTPNTPTVTVDLTAKAWQWVKTVHTNGAVVVPNKPTSFNLTMTKTGNFSATTDCNSVGGNYSVNGSLLNFMSIYQTEMYCEDSQEAEFIAMLSGTVSYRTGANNELILELQDGGEVFFR